MARQLDLPTGGYCEEARARGRWKKKKNPPGKRWIKKAIKKPGALTATARRAGFADTMKFARHVAKNKRKYSKKTVDRAELAIRLQSFRKNPKPKAGGKQVARRRRRRRTRRSARRNAPMGGRLGNIGKLLAVSVGFAAAQLPMLDNRPMADIPVTYAGLLGGALYLTRWGKGDAVRFAALGLLLGGGVQEAVSGVIGPALGSVGALGGASNG